jgi:hypothetical protein
LSKIIIMDNIIKTLVSKMLLLVLIGFYIITSAQNGLSGKKGKEKINVNIKSKGQSDFLLTVHREESKLDWKGDTIVIVSWWDAKGVEQSQTVTSGNNWLAEYKSTGFNYSVKYSHKQLGFSFQILFFVHDDILLVNIPSSGITEVGEARLKSLRLLPYFGAALEGDEGYLVLPMDVGGLCHFKDKKPGEYDIPMYGGLSGCDMPLFGTVHDESGYAGIITGGQFDAEIHVSLNSGIKGTYSVDPTFILRSFVKEKRLIDDINVQYHFLAKEEASWMGIAKRYKNYNTVYRNILPLKERVKNSPELAYSAQALEVRMRMGVKPVPPQVLEQTPKNEPPVQVFLTFQKIRDIFDEFYRQGIKHSEFCIVGWEVGGMGGRIPQYFPVEQAFGGEEELKKTISYGQSLGYQIVSYDDYDDSYRISKDWSEENVRKKPDGQLWKGGKWGAGQSYKLCRIQAYENFAKRDLPKVRELGFKGVHYNDVLSIIGPFPCYDPKHPATRRQDAEANNKILALSKEIFGGVQSEGALDFTATVLDRVLYIAIHSKKSPVMRYFPYVDELVPLYPAVYHGTLLYTVWNYCVNTEPGDEFYLKNIEYGGMPLAYFYGHFRLDEGNWLGARDLRYDDKEGLQKTVKGLRDVYDDFQNLKHLQLEFIEGHKELAEGVYETIYSNGERVVVNYKEITYQDTSGEEVPAKGFKLIRNNLK